MENKMRRKLIKQGKNALTVTLPAKWVEDNGLKGGDEVEIGEKEGTLSIASQGNAKALSKTLMFQNVRHDFLRTVISSYYRRGYVELILKFKEKPPYAIISHVVSSLRGYEITDYELNSCTVKDVMKNQYESSEQSVNKLLQMI